MDNTNKEARQLLEFMINAEDCELDLNECKEYLSNIRGEVQEEVDFTFEFEGVEHRIINRENILEILADELTSDLYCLGCFNANFIAEQCNWPQELVECAKEGDAYEALGKAIKENADMEEFAEAYANADGYGHHFNGWDGSENEIGEYYVFRLGA
jgi:hypothetical protein